MINIFLFDSRKTLVIWSSRSKRKCEYYLHFARLFWPARLLSRLQCVWQIVFGQRHFLYIPITRWNYFFKSTNPNLQEFCRSNQHVMCTLNVYFLFYFLNRSSDNHRLSNLFVGCPHMEIFGTIIWWRRWSRRYTRFAVRQGMPQCSAIRVCAPVRFEIYVCDVTSRTTTREAAASSPYIQVVYWWLRARAVAFTSNRLYGRAGAHILRQQFRA